MTDKEILTYRALIGVIVRTSVVAAMATYLASCNDAAWEGLTALVDSVPLIPARYWSQGSDFPDLAAIYFLWAAPVFPASVAAFAARLWTPNVTSWGWRGPNFELKVGSSSLFMLALGAIVLWSMDGADVLGVSIGSHLADLLLLGWIHFAIAGCATGLGVVGLRRLLGASTPTSSY